MKRVLIVLMMVVPMLASAQFKYKEVKTNPKYLSGAVSTASDGKVYVERTVNVAGKSVKEVMAEVDLLFGSVVAPAKYVEVSRSDNMRIYRMEDELIFRRSFMATNVATMSARMMVSVSGDVCTICFDNIMYMQGTSSTTTTGMPHEKWKSGWSVADNNVEVITAEESISDEEAIKKTTTKTRASTQVNMGPFNVQIEEGAYTNECLTRWLVADNNVEVITAEEPISDEEAIKKTTTKTRASTQVNMGPFNVQIEEVAYTNEYLTRWSVADNNVEVIIAEEPISNEEAIKKTTKTRASTQANLGPFNVQTEDITYTNEYLVRWSAKYRVKTIDYVEAVAAVLQKRLDK